MKKILLITSCLIILFVFCSCSLFLERDYNEDIIIPLESNSGEIIIREWSFLQGSCAEIYYKNGRKETMLGQLQGGDDGYCPFKYGEYSVTIKENQLTIKWYAMPNWLEKTFDLPAE